MSENSIKFSLSNSEQRDSWLNSSHWTLDTDTGKVISSHNVDFIEDSLPNDLAIIDNISPLS